MKIKLLRASNTIKEIEFAMTLPSIDIHRSVPAELNDGLPKKPPPGRGDGFRLALVTLPQRKGHTAMLVAAG